jgi:hypothetical protein
VLTKLYSQRRAPAGHSYSSNSNVAFIKVCLPDAIICRLRSSRVQGDCCSQSLRDLFARVCSPSHTDLPGVLCIYETNRHLSSAAHAGRSSYRLLGQFEGCSRADAQHCRPLGVHPCFERAAGIFNRPRSRDAGRNDARYRRPGILCLRRPDFSREFTDKLRWPHAWRHPTSKTFRQPARHNRLATAHWALPTVFQISVRCSVCRSRYQHGRYPARGNSE